MTTYDFLELVCFMHVFVVVKVGMKTWDAGVETFSSHVHSQAVGKDHSNSSIIVITVITCSFEVCVAGQRLQ